MKCIKYIRQSSISLLVTLLFLLPRLSESCISCFHLRNAPHNHNTDHHQLHSITVGTSRRFNSYIPVIRTDYIAVATTAPGQLLEICKKRCLNLYKSICTIPHYDRSLRLSASAILVAGGMIAIAHHRVPPTMKQKLHRGIWRNELADGQDDKAIPNDDNRADGDAESRTDEEKSVTSTAMIATIGIYKNFISPLLPPACRFVPTCSQYGVQAIKEYGPGKGVILTSWRLLRCSPFGGKGYDPPKWPPVSYTYSSY